MRFCTSQLYKISSSKSIDPQRRGSTIALDFAYLAPIFHAIDLQQTLHLKATISPKTNSRCIAFNNTIKDTSYNPCQWPMCCHSTCVCNCKFCHQQQRLMVLAYASASWKNTTLLPNLVFTNASNFMVVNEASTHAFSHSIRPFLSFWSK